MTAICRKDLLKVLYVDRAGIFGGPKQCNFSQMQRACNELGIEIIFANSPQEKGPQALKCTYRQDHHHKNRTDKEIENVVIAFLLENPHLGQVQVSAQLKANHQIELSPAGVRYVWLRENMQTSALRVQRSKSSLAVA